MDSLNDFSSCEWYKDFARNKLKLFSLGFNLIEFDPLVHRNMDFCCQL